MLNNQAQTHIPNRNRDKSSSDSLLLISTHATQTIYDCQYTFHHRYRAKRKKKKNRNVLQEVSACVKSSICLPHSIVNKIMCDDFNIHSIFFSIVHLSSQSFKFQGNFFFYFLVFRLFFYHPHVCAFFC